VSKREHRRWAGRLEVLLMHLLKWRYQPRRYRGSWARTIREQRRQLVALRTRRPSLHAVETASLHVVYPQARQRAVRETGLPDTTFPGVCPWTTDQVLHDDFWPEGDEGGA